MAILSRLTRDQSFSVRSENPTQIHPLETFHPSMDYDKFESEFICPYLRTARIRRADHASSQLHLTLAPGQASFVDLLSALEETDYNQSLRSLESSVMPTPSLDEAPHPTHILPLTGFIIGIRPDCFVWEGGFFKKGSFVVLGESGRTGTVKGICGFGRNFILRGFEEYGKSPGEVPIYRMVVSASPTSAALSVAHRLASLFLSPFLGSMLDFLGEGGMEDSLEKDNLTDISGLSRSTLISPSEVEVAGAEEYLEGEGN
jgi:hypothetical protein